MKTRTKEFVTKLKEEQAEQMAAFTTQMQQKEAALVQVCPPKLRQEDNVAYLRYHINL